MMGMLTVFLALQHRVHLGRDYRYRLAKLLKLSIVSDETVVLRLKRPAIDLDGMIRSQGGV